ncbi:hypothetical protein [Coleofasciculus sp. C1-SOL-03]
MSGVGCRGVGCRVWGVVAWHTLFDELELRPETVGAQGLRPV